MTMFVAIVVRLINNKGKEFEKENLLSELQIIFDNKEIGQLVRNTRFIQRSSPRLGGESFLVMNIFDSTESSLRDLD